MNKYRCRLIFLFFFLFVISIANLGCAQQNIEQPGVEYVVWPGVTSAAKADAEFGINETIIFFQDTYDIKLNRHIKVILVADNSSYKTALLQETGASELETERRVRTSVAWSFGHTIIRNTAKANDKLNNVFKISHEMVHQYQEQETGGVGMKIEWFTEGMADIIAAHVIDKVHLMPITQFERAAQSTLSATKNPPSLTELHSSVDWNKALETYGAAVTYRSADVGVLFLTQKHGLPSLMVFLRELRKTGIPAVAFPKIFVVDMNVFEQQHTDYLHSLARKVS